MARGRLVEERVTHAIIGAFFEVHRTLGSGFLESLYAAALERELLARGHQVGREVGVQVFYKGEPLGTQRLDMVVDDKVVVELKSTFDLRADCWRQLHSYLRATRLEVGLLLHFGRSAQFHRIVCSNGPSSATSADSA